MARIGKPLRKPTMEDDAKERYEKLQYFYMFEAIGLFDLLFFIELQNACRE